MELDEEETPQKLPHKFIFNYKTKAQGQLESHCQRHKGTPKNSKCLKKIINPRTPKTQSISYSMAACSSMVSAGCSSVHSFSMAVAQTPPAKRYHRVKNPFEAALAERLHLPLIGSPSLFQRPNTPQMSSTQFEWTIDEVSSLKPAHLEPHETQFQDSPNPELEAKAQSAISSYFKEHQIVPSPIDCPLRSNRIILSEISGNTPISKPGRRIRDCSSQTELTLPPILPPSLEEALKPYFQSHLAGSGEELCKFRSSRSWNSNTDIKDTSLRRKLFDMQNIVVLENDNQTPHAPVIKTANNSGQSNSSPMSLKSLQHTAIVGKLSDSLDKSSFGSLSPISACDSLSPNYLSPRETNRGSRFRNFLSEVDIELLSPIHPPIRRKNITENNISHFKCQVSNASKNELIINNTCNEGEENGRFTPERSSSPLNNITCNNIAEFSTDSFNVKVSRLKVNSSNRQSDGQERHNETESKSITEIDIFQHDENTEDILDNTVDMDEIQVSRMSSQSSNCSSSQSDTPKSKRKSASRKNLSRSFSANWLDDNEEETEVTETVNMKEIFPDNEFVVKTSESFCSANEQMPTKNLTFYRADSGFNEMSQNSLSPFEAIKADDTKQLGFEKSHDILVCCSTPSTKKI